MKSLALGEVQNTSRSLQIVEIFKTALAEGTFKIGDRLPPERELAELLGTGRSSLREAIRILSAYGIVEARQGEGTFITDRFVENVFDFLGFTNVTNKQNYYHLMKMREVFEVGSVDMVCDHIGREDVDALQRFLDGFDQAVTHEEKAKYDVCFHERLVECTKNPIFIRVYNMSLKLLYSLIDNLLPHHAVQTQASMDHRDILGAVRCGDRLACREAVRTHLDHISGFLEKYENVVRE